MVTAGGAIELQQHISAPATQRTTHHRIVHASRRAPDFDSASPVGHSVAAPTSDVDTVAPVGAGATAVSRTSSPRVSPAQRRRPSHSQASSSSRRPLLITETADPDNISRSSEAPTTSGNGAASPVTPSGSPPSTAPTTPVSGSTSGTITTPIAPAATGTTTDLAPTGAVTTGGLGRHELHAPGRHVRRHRLRDELDRISWLEPSQGLGDGLAERLEPSLRRLRQGGRVHGHEQLIDRYLEKLDHEELLVRRGQRSGLYTIVAVHCTARGPALGGCRMWAYDDARAAVRDALRLSRAMTLKAAVADLALGGGKGVVMTPADSPLPLRRRHAALLDFADLVESLDGRYITAEDVGTSSRDMSVIAQRTSHVAGLARSRGGSGDPSPLTALGVEAAIRATCERAFGDGSLRGRSICVLGLGHVGSRVAKRCARAGASLILSDLDEGKRRLAERLGADWTTPERALEADVDVLVPCALGALLRRCHGSAIALSGGGGRRQQPARR